MKTWLSAFSCLLFVACQQDVVIKQGENLPLKTEKPSPAAAVTTRPDEPTPPSRNTTVTPNGPAEPSSPIDPVPALSDIRPDITLKAIRHKPDDMKIHSPKEACRVERGPKQTPPSQFKFAGTSPDKTNALYVDDGFKGGDHTVFDEISASIEGKDKQLMIVTETESILVESKTEYGAAVNYRDGTLTCQLGYPEPRRPSDYGPLTHYAHNNDVSDLSSRIWVRGRTRDNCLTVLDENSIPFLAVFPKPLKAGVTYRWVRTPSHGERPLERMHWLNSAPSPVQGVKVSLTDAIPECGHISHAILLADSPEISIFGFSFPENK